MFSQLDYDLYKMKSFEAIKDILPGIELHPLQCIDIMRMLASKKCMITYDTGTGKTFLANGAMRLLLNEDPTRKFIMIVKKDQLIQTPPKVENGIRRAVTATCADYKSLRKTIYNKDFLNYTVLMITHECLSNRQVLNELFKVKHLYCGVVIDEAHELNNNTTADAPSILSGFTRHFEYVWALTATPIRTDAAQLARLAYIVDHERYSNPVLLKKRLINGTFTLEHDPGFFINRNEEEMGRITKPIGDYLPVIPLDYQKECHSSGNELMKITRGKGAYRQANAVIEFIRKQLPNRGIIFVWQHEVREALIPYLDEAQIRYDCINSRTSFKERDTIMHKYNVEKSLDVVVLSVTTAIDLECDYCLFYEFTTDIKQMIGRGHRGLHDKQFLVVFLITLCQAEVNYFLNNIYQNSLDIQRIMKKDFSEVISVGQKLGAYEED